MQHTTLLVRAFFLCLPLLACPVGLLHAQTADKKPVNSAQSKPLQASGIDASLYDAGTQRIERIHIEDGGSRVDELRYGGVVERIVVQPKFDVPAYEILPNDKVTSRPRGRDGAPPTHSQRVWNVLGF